jgi:two-component sensor histidine kinase
VLALADRRLRRENAVDQLLGRLSVKSLTFECKWCGQHRTVKVDDLIGNDRTGRRVALQDPSVGLPAIIAIPLGLAFHELATNAAKYGALSDIAAVVTVKWRTEIEDGREMLHIQWDENNGPQVTEPKREGFGTRLLNRALPAQAGAQVTLNFAPMGLRADLSMPLVKHSA